MSIRTSTTAVAAREDLDAGAAVREVLARLGIGGAIGVGDSQLGQVMREMSQRMPVMFTAREDVAVAMAFGSELVGVQQVVFMKNAGLGTSLDALISLAIGTDTPLTLIVGWAGAGSDSLPHHVIAGDRTIALLDAIGLQYEIVEPEGNDVNRLVDRAVGCRSHGASFVLLVRP